MLIAADRKRNSCRWLRRAGARLVGQRLDPGDGQLPGDDPAQGVRELGAGGQHPLGVGLARRDLQQRDDLVGGFADRPDRQVRQLEHLLNPDTGVPQHLHYRPGPERSLLRGRQVDPRPSGSTAITTLRG